MNIKTIRLGAHHIIVPNIIISIIIIIVTATEKYNLLFKNSLELQLYKTVFNFYESRHTL